MRIVIAGSSGYLGTELRRAWKDHEIIRLVRRPSRHEGESFWDPYDDSLDYTALQGADAVVNLCGVPIAGRRWNSEYKDEIRRSRVVPTRVLAKAVGSLQIPLFLSASATGWYGHRPNVEVDETYPASQDFLGLTTQAWEDAAQFAAEGGTRVVTLRTGHVLGPSSPLLRKLLPFFRLCLGGRFGNGRQHMPWISVRDWVGAVTHALSSPISGPMNLVGPVSVTNRHFTVALAQAIHRPAPWIIPGWAARLVAGEAAVEMLHGVKVTPRVLLDDGYRFRDSTVEEALAQAVSGTSVEY